MNIKYFAYGRTALKYGIIILGLKRDDEVLIPEYICDVVLQPFNQLGIQYSFFHVNEDLSVDWLDIKKKINNNTKAIIMVNYFGQPQEVEKYLSFCKSNNLFLIEDNAHGHGGIYNKKPLGTFGDIGISSPRKNFSINFGGILYFKEKYSNNFKKLPFPPKLVVFKKMAVKKINPLLFLFKIKNRNKPDYDIQHSGRDKKKEDWQIDKKSKYYLEKLNISNIRENRQKLYSIWREFSIQNNLKPIFENLAPNVNPLVFPALTNSHKESIKWFNWGWENNIDIRSWPTLPLEIIEQNASAMRLWERIICFPIENEINKNKLTKKLNKGF